MSGKSMKNCNLLKLLLLQIFLLTGFESPVSAGIGEERGAAGLRQALVRLQTSARVLYVVAHPDDEDAGTLTLLARKNGARVVLLSLTRGEAGANLISGDTFDRLGALRTLEHLRAAENYGVELRYTRFADFGYSKNLEETWKNWDRNQLLEDVVRVVREVRPHVIIARFQGTARDGHGHHTASGLMARQAFTAAADPTRFPSAGEAWKALRLYSGNWRAGEPGTMAVDSGEFNPVLGRSYAEIGREGYRFQRSQAMGAVLAGPGPSLSYYKREDQPDAGEKSFLDGLGSRIEPPESLVAPARGALDAWPSPRVAAFLVEGLRKAREAKDTVWEDKFNEALNRALAVTLEARVEPKTPNTGAAARFRPSLTFRAAAPGTEFALSAKFHARAADTGTVELVRHEAFSCGGPIREQSPGQYLVTLDCPPTVAHWRRDSIRNTSYQTDLQRALPQSPLKLRAVYRFGGVEASIERIPETSQIDSIGLQVREPLILGPGISVRFRQETMVVRPGQRKLETDVVVRNESEGTREGQVSLRMPDGWKADPEAASFRLEREGEEARLAFTLIPPSSVGGAVEVRAEAQAGPLRSDYGFERITYSGLGSIYLAPPARMRLQPVDVRVAQSLKIGYVMGSGDPVPDALRQLGADVDMLDAAAIAGADLARYSVIMLGIRAYAVRPELAVHNQRLLGYVREGGVVIVQYNTQEYDRNFGPYPYSMTARAEEVSEEDAPVTVLSPGARVFQGPNRITPQDWDGWFEQRGSKFFTTWDSRWEPLIETHDTGQAPQKGVWLQAPYGKGLYVYCSLAFYRQLPMGVPGAWRLLANLVSLGAR